MTRTTARGAGALALALLAVVLVAAPAHAAAYRYWTYWQVPAGSTAWAFATQGPGTSVPADGSVEGWSFGVTTQSGNLDDAPSTKPDFDALCSDTQPAPGRKRVALIVDPGPGGLAPAGQDPPAPVATCVLADDDASGYEILRSVAEVRIEGGLVCGVGGYPTGECAPVLDAAEATALLAAASTSPESVATPSATGMSPGESSATSEGSSSPVATIVVAIALIALAGLIIRRVRRTR